VVSIDPFNATTNRVVVLPTSSRVRGWATEIPYQAGDNLTGVILCDQVRTIDWRVRFAKKAGSVDLTILADVRAKLALIMGLGSTA
jgi:mRNA-degrading endonuclease toxin of MazEF toxin-antitoxin module